MATETVSEVMYEELIKVDSQLHTIISKLKHQAKKVSLSQVQQHIATSLPPEIEDTTKTIRSLREKHYA